MIILIYIVYLDRAIITTKVLRTISYEIVWATLRILPIKENLELEDQPERMVPYTLKENNIKINKKDLYHDKPQLKFFLIHRIKGMKKKKRAE